MVGGPKYDYTKVISGLLKKSLILSWKSWKSYELLLWNMKFFYEKHFCGFLFQPGWFRIVLEVSYKTVSYKKKACKNTFLGPTSEFVKLGN